MSNKTEAIGNHFLEVLRLSELSDREGGLKELGRNVGHMEPPLVADVCSRKSLVLRLQLGE